MYAGWISGAADTRPTNIPPPHFPHPCATECDRSLKKKLPTFVVILSQLSAYWFYIKTNHWVCICIHFFNRWCYDKNRWSYVGLKTQQCECIGINFLPIQVRQCVEILLLWQNEYMNRSRRNNLACCQKIIWPEFNSKREDCSLF